MRCDPSFHILPRCPVGFFISHLNFIVRRAWSLVSATNYNLMSMITGAGLRFPRRSHDCLIRGGQDGYLGLFIGEQAA